jgi:hypothetical protein
MNVKTMGQRGQRVPMGKACNGKGPINDFHQRSVQVIFEIPDVAAIVEVNKLMLAYLPVNYPNRGDQNKANPQ